MLEQMRRQARSFLMYIIFGILIAVFVVNFGPQSQGCTPTTTEIGRIDSESITISNLNYALNVAGIRSAGLNGPQASILRGAVLDRYILRQLIVRDARGNDLRVGDREIEDMLLKGRFLALGTPRAHTGPDQAFDYDRFSKTVRYNFSVTVPSFREEQRQEMIAERQKEILAASVKVSRQEVLNEFLQQNDQVELDFVRFSPTDFQAELGALSAKDPRISDFIKTNEKKIRAIYSGDQNGNTSPTLGKATAIKPKETKRSFDEMKGEIALKLFRAEEGKGRARKAAERALGKLKAGETLAALFPSTPNSEASGQPRAADASDQQVLDEAADSANENARKVETSPFFSRSLDYLVPGIGISKKITEAAFNLGKASTMPAIFNVGPIYYLVVLKTHRKPDMAVWKAQSDDLIDRFQERRSQEFLKTFQSKLCRDALSDKRIVVDSTLLAPPAAIDSAKAAPPPPSYVPCASLGTT